MNPTENQPNVPAASGDNVFDVRPIPGRTKHAQIFQRWLDLPVGQHFILLNDHDPVPLYYQFNAEFPGAFSWVYRERGPEEYRVEITKLKAVEKRVGDLPVFGRAPSAEKPSMSTGTKGSAELDVRGLEPPEPLVRILDALETLPVGAVLRARTDREPCHLFGEAEQRGFRHDCNEQSDGSWLTTLTRA